GAGSGKTRVLTARIAHLIEHRGVAPSRIFAVTFTNKAAGEMRALEAALLGVGPNFTIYDQDDSEAFLKRLVEERGLSPKAYPPRALHAVISAAKNRMRSPDDLAASAESPLERVAAELYGALGPALRRANAMDFDDL